MFLSKEDAITSTTTYHGMSAINVGCTKYIGRSIAYNYEPSLEDNSARAKNSMDRILFEPYSNLRLLLSLFAVISCAEDTGADTHRRRAAVNGDGVVVRHTHREGIELLAEEGF